MPAIPAQCTNPSCRAIYPSGIWVENSANVRLFNNRQDCPVCGSVGYLAEGIFNVTNDAIEVVSAPGTTLEMLVELQSIMQRARDGNISVEEAEKQVAALQPSFAALFRHVKDNAAVYSLVLMILLWAIDTWQDHGSPDYGAQIVNLLEQHLANDRDQEGSAPADAKPEQPRIIAPTAPATTGRRARRNAIRRAKLKAHRSAFGGSALIHKFQNRPLLS